ncbi:MAG: type II toxin-antitoxin system VapC family toxin [bacterium]|nr:type II toxin-antitoxin system VapC family toxin [bacterium]
MRRHDALVSDTHPILYHANGGRRLSAEAAAHFNACERRQAILYVPAAVIWEVSVLFHAGKVDLGRSPQRLFEALFSNPAYQPVDLTPEQIYLADEIRPNDDPFDALICAAARSLELPLLTRDTEIEESGLEVVW